MQQGIVFFIIVLSLVMFVWGRIRHDIVALIALLLLVASGIIPGDEAFDGFSNPAVISVAAVLIVSEGLRKSGTVEYASRFILKPGNSLGMQIFILSCLTCIASAFMNNIGALAIFMPVAIHITRKSGHEPSFILMPLAFASLLGGMTTMIGTPPNILISAYRNNVKGSYFGIFDFTPVGLLVSLAGILFITAAGWRLLPRRTGDAAKQDRFNIDSYITEIKIEPDSPLSGMEIRRVNEITGAKVNVLGLIRPIHEKGKEKLLSKVVQYLSKSRQHVSPAKSETETILAENDILVIETGSKDIKDFLINSRTSLVGDRDAAAASGKTDDNLFTVAEVVVLPDSPVEGESASNLRMRARYGISLLAIARKDKKLVKRIDNVKFSAGDVLLVKGRRDMLDDRIKAMGCLPLADRNFSIERPKKMVLALLVFAAAIILVVTEVFPVQVSFTLAAVVMVITGVIPVHDVWSSVDWPVIVLLGALLPLGKALEITGGAAAAAGIISSLGSTMPVWALLAILVFATMLLSAAVNNAATVVLMAPVALSAAVTLNVSADTFLMAVAIGASSSFLTPIAHQSNTLVMGPGGYKFGDYLRLGLPLSVIVCITAVPALLFFWPL